MSGDATVKAHVSTRAIPGTASRSGVASKHNTLGTCSARSGRRVGVIQLRIAMLSPPSQCPLAAIAALPLVEGEGVFAIQSKDYSSLMLAALPIFW